ncbi:MAG: ABC transporter substrate-binding protein [Anaerolineae bacterium]|nr:ABC transporter substrate-binding protein [Anaerolineae bacterium]
MKVSRLAILLLVLALLVVGAAQAQDEKVLVVGHAEATDSLDPARGYNQTTSLIHQTIYEALVTFPEDSAAEILPGLASDWAISDDGLTYTFNLNPAAVFASGAPVTAEDVAFSFNRMINVQGQPSSLASTVASVAAVDGQVVITLTQPDPSLLAKLAGPGFQVTEAALVQANGGTDAADAATTDAGEAWLNGHSAGSGRYMLDSWEPQVQTVLVRNPNYYGAEPGYYDRIIIVNMPEAATQKAALESGEIDMALDVTADQVPSLQSADGITVYQGSGNIIHFLLMNANPDVGGPMSDPNVQQAVRLALDYPGYVSLFGGVNPASIIPAGFLTAYGPDRALTRDLDAARALLAEAGYADGFEVTLNYPVFTFQGVNMETNAQKVAADLAEIGITVNLNPGEIQVALESYRNGLDQFSYWFWGPDFIDPLNYVEFLPGMKVGGTRAQWTDERADETILSLRDQALVESDPAARTAVFEAIQDYMQQNGPFAPFLQPGVQVAYASDIENYFWHPQWTVDLSILSSAE